MSEPLSPDRLPWAPLFTQTRGNVPEVTVYGQLYVWAEDRQLFANAGRSLLKVGDVHAPLWSRSLLKPFQLMALYPTLKSAYPALTEAHFTLMLASHQGDAPQLAGLREILTLGGLTESALQCPACACLSRKNPQAESALHHPCAGKHLAHLLFLQAQGLPVKAYLQPDAPPYALQRDLLAYLLNREDFALSVDGCGMPNFALSAVETAQLYQALLAPISRDLVRQCPDELTDILEQWPVFAALMRQYPALVGGEGRLDSRLIRGEGLTDTTIPVIAKEGADGLLCVALGPNPQAADGLGIFIKLAHGYDAPRLETVLPALFDQLGLADPPPALAAPVQTHWHLFNGHSSNGHSSRARHSQASNPAGA